jgi:hypothetical protein
MSKPADWRVLAAVLLLALPTCDGDADGEGGAGGGVQALAFCDDHAAKRCERLFACLPLYATQVYGDVKICGERFRTSCRIEAALTGTGLARSSSDACLEAMTAASCDDVFLDGLEACQLKGTLAAGVACGFDSQCASGFCRTPETSFCGVCEARALEGAECDSDRACAFPFLCSATGRCTKAGNEGDTCSQTAPCRRETFYCSNGDGTCKRYGSQGGTCNEGGPGIAAYCDWGLTCEPDGIGTCQPIRMVLAGQACGPAGGGGPGSPAVFCEGSASCIDRICQPPGKDGEACTVSPLGDSGGCLPPALCLGGICKLPEPAVCK